ncbi:UBP-type zinc finger domain-containing protein [Dyadobacter sandarakinus]|uniref:UBP-type zinc finger domain-containing protein n=1 Tax=Dyadobacter sandarakinus TaxID=2747268 RepID=A0ABX7I360_9BACT|nr:UBP-type zinc finger domain-containing protein [Dyadobacter sandarakinus]QRR00526.1 UBP-type zinc finger domain-containing protein [Dyadobacter sandarakinus]
MEGVCEHINALETVRQPAELICEECVKTDGSWVHLRTCQTCGVTLCCDSSPSKHMTKHFHRSGHPVVISAEPGERWLWCYKDESFVAYE